MIYSLFFRLVLRRIPAETAHRLAFGAMRAAAAVPGVRHLLRRLLAPRDPVLEVEAFGRTFPGPLGLAAGFDKDAKGIRALETMGFGYVEVGTITAHPQPGNPPPRLFRVTGDHALINRMGFNNAGAEEVADRLERKVRGARHAAPLGVNIGKTKLVPEDGAIADYRASARLLAPFADYLVVNVSSPNTPGLRNLQAVDKMRPLLEGVRQEIADTPLLVKIAPDLADADIDTVADLAVELGLDGIIATNTAIGREGLTADPGETGGLSGRPLRQRSLEVLRRLHDRTGDRLVLISAGGIESADDAWERIEAGARLLQAYTGFIYGGPFWVRRIHRELARRAGRGGFARLADAVGGAAP